MFPFYTSWKHQETRGFIIFLVFISKIRSFGVIVKKHDFIFADFIPKKSNLAEQIFAI